MNDRKAFYKQVGEKIRVKRKERKLSQEGLAKAVGLKRPSMSTIEHGEQNLLLHTLCEIAETLDTDAASLLPDRVLPEPDKTPDLSAYSKGVREFVEAGIRTASKKKR